MELLGNRPAADRTNSRRSSRDFEQVAALEAHATIGGLDAAQAVTRLLLCNVIQAPGLRITLAAAAQLRSSLPAKIVSALLRHRDPAMRAKAYRCAGYP